MAKEHASTGEPVARYDLHCQGTLPESLRRRNLSMSVRTTGAQTALFRPGGGPAELDALLQELLAVGVVLTEVHQLPKRLEPRPGRRHRAPRRAPVTSGSYEVRVQGELGARMLRHLRWSHYFVPEQTLVRLQSTPTELHHFLQECTDAGLVIDRVRRVDRAPTSPQPGEGGESA